MDKKEAAFLVTTTDGTFVDGYKEEDQAKASVTNRNARAEALGIKARYKVVPAA